MNFFYAENFRESNDCGVNLVELKFYVFFTTFLFQKKGVQRKPRKKFEVNN